MTFVKKHYRRLVDTFTSWSSDGGGLLAAAVAYYAGLSFFPILLLLVAGLGKFFEVTEAGVSARKEILTAIESQFSESLALQIDEILQTVGAESDINGIVGWATLSFAAIAIFVQFDAAFDRIWNRPSESVQGWQQTLKRLVVDRLVAFVMLCVVGVLVVAVSLSSVVISGVRSYLPLPAPFWNLLTAVVPVLLNIAAFSVLYRVVPKVRVRWSEAVRGAIFAAVLWEAGRWVLSAILIGGRYTSAYQIIGSFIAVLLWMYYAFAIVFLGAEYIQSFCRECDRHKHQESNEVSAHGLMVPTS